VSHGIRTAFVLGAGLGTRLRPLTDTKPKPLVPIFGKPLITFALDHLAAAGVQSFVINTHHLASQFEEIFSSAAYPNVRLVHEPVLLETGGGIKNAEALIGPEPFIVYSGDILTDIDVEILIAEHFRQSNDVTLALRETGLAAGVTLRDGKVSEMRGAGNCDFANVSIWNPSVFSRIPAGEKISFVPILREWIAQGGKIGGVLLNEKQWFNIGSRKEYLGVHRLISETNWRPPYVINWPVAIDTHAQIAASAKLEGFYAIGAGVEIGEEATVRDTVIWENAKIASRSDLHGCIVRTSCLAQGTAREADI